MAACVCDARNRSYGSRGCPRSRGGYGAGSHRRVATIPAKAGIHPWGAGDGPLPTAPLWVPACAGTTWFHRHSCESRNPSLGRRGGPRPIAPLWVPASAGTTWFHRHSCESRNPSLGRGRGPRPTSPFWVPASAGTTWFHRLSCEACPRGNGEQESIPHNRPNSHCKPPKIGLQIVDKAKAFAIPFRAVIP